MVMAAMIIITAILVIKLYFQIEKEALRERKPPLRIVRGAWNSLVRHESV